MPLGVAPLPLAASPAEKKTNEAATSFDTEAYPALVNPNRTVSSASNSQRPGAHHLNFFEEDEEALYGTLTRS